MNSYLCRTWVEYGTNTTQQPGRIPQDTKQETKIYPLPHTYVVKDIVPDLTHFYKQYKSIKPYLQRDTKAEDVKNPPFSLQLQAPKPNIEQVD